MRSGWTGELLGPCGFELDTRKALTCSGEQADLAKGTTHLVKYALVERWISLGWAEVL